VLNSYRLCTVFEPFYWYRRSGERLRYRHYSQRAGDYRVPPSLKGVLCLTQGLVHRGSMLGPPFQAGGATRSADAQALIQTVDSLAEFPRLFAAALDLCATQTA